MPRGISARWCRSTRARRVSLSSLPALRSLIRTRMRRLSTRSTNRCLKARGSITMSIYNVFNIDQTNMKEARPEIYEKIILENGGKKQEHKGEMFHFDAMDRMMEENRWICPIKQLHGDSAFYSISKKLIVLPEFSQFKDGESFYGTAFHEMAHSTGAEEHLNRLKPAAFGSAEYAQEELVAELTSAMVCPRRTVRLISNHGSPRFSRMHSTSRQSCSMSKEHRL